MDPLSRDHLGSEAEGEDPGTATEGENDLTISVSNLGSRDSDTSEGGHAATKMRQTLPISRLKVEQKKLLSQQRTLQRAFEHLKTRALDSYEVHTYTCPLLTLQRVDVNVLSLHYRGCQTL